MQRLYWVCVVLIFLMAACAGTAAVEPAQNSEPEATAVASAADSNAVTYTDDVAGFSIVLPAGWTTVEGSEEAFAKMRSTAGENGSLSFLSDDDVQALLQSGLQLYVLNEASVSLNSELPISIKIIRREAPTSMSLDEYVTSTAAQFEATLELTTPLEQAAVLLGEDEAMQLRYARQTQTTVGTIAAVHNTQYYLLNGGDLFIITLEMGQDLVDDYLAAGETAVETFRLTTDG